MPNAVEILTRLIGLPQTQQGLQSLERQVSGVGRAANEAAPGVQRFGGAIGEAGAAVSRLTGIAVGGGLLAFLGASALAARNAERTMRGVGAAVHAAGQDFALLRPHVDRTIRGLEDLTGMASGDLARALNQLVTLTGDVQRSMALLPIVTDLAAAKQMDLASAAVIVGRAAQGQTEFLRRLGIQLREGATATEALAELQRRFAGQAAEQADAIDRLSVAWSRFMEAVGAPVFSGLARFLDLLTKIANVLGAIMRGPAPGQLGEIKGPMLEDPALRALAEATQERAREGLRGLAAGPLTTVGLSVTLKADRDAMADLDAALEKAARNYAVFRDAQIRAKAEAAALQAAIQALSAQGIQEHLALILELKTRYDAAVATFERAAGAMAVAAAQTGREVEARRLMAETVAGTSTAVTEATRAESAAREDARQALDRLAVAEADLALATLNTVQAMRVEAEAIDAVLRATARSNLIAVQVQQAEETLAALEANQQQIVRDADVAAKAAKAMWEGVGEAATSTLTGILVGAESWADGFKRLFRQLMADLVSTVLRSGLQRAFASQMPGTIGGGTVTTSLSGTTVTGGGAGTTGGLGFLGGAGVGAAAAIVSNPAWWRSFGGQWSWERGLRVPYTFGLSETIPALLSVFGVDIGSGARRRRERGRNENLIQEFIGRLGGLGIDPATAQRIVAQQQARWGWYGSGPAADIMRSFLLEARRGGLTGEVAGRGLLYVTAPSKVQAAMREELAGITGGVAGFGPEAARAAAILAQTPQQILRGWKEVDAFFVQFARTLANVSGALEEGVVGGVAQAARAFLEGSGSLAGTLRQGIRAAVTEGIVQAVISGPLIEGTLGPVMARLRDALVKGGDAAAIIRELAGLLPGLTATLTALLAPLRPALGALGPTSAGLGVQLVPAFQHGGLVTAPTLALVGERGPEAIVPLGRGGGPIRLEVPVYLNGREVGRGLIPDLMHEIRLRTGHGR